MLYKLELVFECEKDRDIALDLLENAEWNNDFAHSFGCTKIDTPEEKDCDGGV